MRRACRTDANQVEVVAALRKHGCTIQHLFMIGKGAPDLLIGYRGKNLLFEIKDGSQPPSRRELTDDEANWHQTWRGQVAIVGSVSEALEYLNGATNAQET